MLSRRNRRCLGMSEYYSDETDVAGGLPNIIRTERTLLGDRSGCYPDEINVAKI